MGWLLLAVIPNLNTSAINHLINNLIYKITINLHQEQHEEIA